MKTAFSKGSIILCLTLLGLAAVIGGYGKNSTSESAVLAAEPTRGCSSDPPFRSLFNGKDLTGWSGDSSIWSVRDETITAHKKGVRNEDNLLVWQGGELGDFELRYKIRITRKDTNTWANAGVVFRAVLTNNAVSIGYLADCVTAGRADTKFMELGTGGRRFLSQGGKTTLLAEGGGVDQWNMIATADDLDKLKGSFQSNGWNQIELTVRGARMTTRLNGFIGADVIDNNKARARTSGAMALKMYSANYAESAVVQFKDIEYRALGTGVEPKETIDLLAGGSLERFFPWVENLPCGEDPDAVFAVTNGILRVSGTAGGFLITRQEFRNYHLVAEFKWGEATWGARKEHPRNAGIWVHSRSGLVRRGEGLECQIRESDTGSLYMSLGSLGQVGNMRKDKAFQKFPRPGLPDGTTKGYRPADEIEVPHGEWNRFEVICDGDKLTILVNGRQTVQASKLAPQGGVIQIESTNAEIFYRKLQLMPLRGFEQ